MRVHFDDTSLEGPSPLQAPRADAMSRDATHLRCDATLLKTRGPMTPRFDTTTRVREACWVSDATS